MGVSVSRLYFFFINITSLWISKKTLARKIIVCFVLSFVVVVRNYIVIRYRSRILSASSYLRTVTPDRLQTPTSLTRAQITRSCWRPDTHTSPHRIPMERTRVRTTVTHFIMKQLNRTDSTSPGLKVIPVHCGSAVADPSGFTPRLEESQLQGPRRIYSHYNNCK